MASKKPPCRCKGRSGVPKKLFANRRAAERTAVLRGWMPQSYRCPSGRGVHLTHGGK